jgi:arginyl-tRNA synthetase
MAALRYRLIDLKRDWIIVVTDAGQANHFKMCFDAARRAGWVKGQRVDHVGFGVVCGKDGKRFKTRSSEVERLADLLVEAQRRMRESFAERLSEGRSALQTEELENAARVAGLGAVKYFDLKQHPATDYVFEYDRMLDTRGDTAVYLLFAYARLASILRGASARTPALAELYARASTVLQPVHPAERALAAELARFNDVILSVLQDLLPNRLCDFLKEVCVKFSDFVTKCRVLDAVESDSRLILCEATRRVMAKSFELLGIGVLERI